MTSAIFLRGERGDEYVIVLTSDLVDPRSRLQLELFLRELDERALDAIAGRRFRALAGGAFNPNHWFDVFEQRDAVADALAYGGLVAARIEPTYLPLEPPPSVRLADLIGTRTDDDRRPASPARPNPTEQTFTYELRLVDELGVPIDDVPISLRVSGSPRQLVTDGDGRVRVDDATTSTSLAQLSDLPVLREALRSRWEQVREGDWLTATEDHTYLDCTDPLPPVKVRSGRPHTIVVQPRVVCARILELLFATNKAFLLPSALGHIHAIVALYEKRPNSKLLIVGHTDSSGEPHVNDPLSLARADSIRAYLTDDVAAWLDFYGSHMSSKARWGATEDDLMLDAILAATGEQLTDTRVRHFQTTRGLTVDGQVGDETRRALITEYMAVDGTTLPSNIEALIHGCGESFPRAPSGAGNPGQAHDRRVELFFFDDDLGVLPPPSGEISDPGSREYPEWCRRALETHDFHVRDARDIEIVVVDDRGEPMVPTHYRLALHDGRVLEGVCDQAGRTAVSGVPFGAGILELTVGSRVQSS